MSGLNLTGYKGTLDYPEQVDINYIQTPSGEIRTGTVRVHHIQNEPASRLATSISTSRDYLDTRAAVLQSHWWDGAFVTTYGVRRDRVKRYNVGSGSYTARTDLTRIYNPALLDAVAADNVAERETFTYSGVLRLNKLIGRWMPRSVEVDAHYGWSENYQGLTGVRSVKGGFFDAPIGETTEKGISVSLFESKLQFRANWFETHQSNIADASVDESINTITNFIPDLYTLQTASQLAEVGFTMPPMIVDSFGLRISQPNAQGFSTYTRSFTGRDIKSSVSRGFEWEGTYNVTRNWRVAFNVAKTKAVESEKGTNWAEVVEWVQKNWFANPAIRALRIGTGGTLDTLGGWEQRAITGFRNVQETNGASNFQVRKWRANWHLKAPGLRHRRRRAFPGSDLPRLPRKDESRGSSRRADCRSDAANHGPDRNGV